MTAVSEEAAWLLLVGLAVVGPMVTLADGRLRWYPRGLLQWCMVIALAQAPYGMLLASGLIPQTETPTVRIVMLPTWIAGVGFAVWKGRRAVLGRWADQELVRILGNLNVLTRITALHRRAEGADAREPFCRRPGPRWTVAAAVWPCCPSKRCLIRWRRSTDPPRSGPSSAPGSARWSRTSSADHRPTRRPLACDRPCAMRRSQELRSMTKRVLMAGRRSPTAMPDQLVQVLI